MNILMRNRILLCVAILAIISIATSNSTGVEAKSLVEADPSVPINTISLAQNNRAEAYKLSGNAKFDRGDYQGAIADYTRAISLDSNFAIAYYNRGNAKSEIGDYSAAIADYTRAIKISHNDSRFYINRGFSKYKLGNKSGALADYQQAVQIDPNDSTAINNINALTQNTRQNEQQRTLRYMNGAGYIQQNTPQPRGLLPR
jgi:tetratricopeptide (TPR) repeat protein